MIARLTDPEHSVIVSPAFVGDKKEMLLELYKRMDEQPDDTLVLIDVKDNHLKALLVAYDEDDHVFIRQAHKSKDMKTPRLMYYKLCQWAKSKGKNKLRLGCEDKRTRRMYKRRYGFHSIGGVEMEKAI